MWLVPRWSRTISGLFEIMTLSIRLSAAVSIRRDRDLNCIDCVMFDTPWAVIRQYVTAFLGAVSHNTAIPLAFAFGRAENCELYDSFHNIFQDRFKVDLSLLTLELDQGSGLGKDARSHSIKHRSCLRHFLATF
jgi:hypothetical protein